MSEIRWYLEAKAATPNEWLRRDPRTTHPRILELVRCAERTIAASRGGTIYDDDVESYVSVLAGDLPPHQRHGTEGRDPLIVQLGHEVYLARTILRDEENQAALDEALADGFAPLADVRLTIGGRYRFRPGTLYSGYSVPVFAKAVQVTARASVNPVAPLALIPKGKRTHGFLAVVPALVKEGWSS